MSGSLLDKTTSESLVLLGILGRFTLAWNRTAALESRIEQQPTKASTIYLNISKFPIRIDKIIHSMQNSTIIVLKLKCTKKYGEILE